MRRLAAVAIVGVLVAATGCGGSKDPEQPKLTDDQVKDVMKAGKEQATKEGGGRRPVK